MSSVAKERAIDVHERQTSSSILAADFLDNHQSIVVKPTIMFAFEVAKHSSVQPPSGSIKKPSRMKLTVRDLDPERPFLKFIRDHVNDRNKEYEKKKWWNARKARLSSLTLSTWSSLSIDGLVEIGTLINRLIITTDRDLRGLQKTARYKCLPSEQQSAVETYTRLLWISDEETQRHLVFWVRKTIARPEFTVSDALTPASLRDIIEIMVGTIRYYCENDQTHVREYINRMVMLVKYLRLYIASDSEEGKQPCFRTGEIYLSVSLHLFWALVMVLDILFQADQIFSWDIPGALFRNYVMLVLLMEQRCRMGIWQQREISDQDIQVLL